MHESGVVYREMIFGSVKVDASKVTCPTLVVGGAKDRIVSDSLLRFTAKRYGAELKLYDRHAHWILEEPGWETVVDDIAAWLERDATVDGGGFPFRWLTTGRPEPKLGSRREALGPR